MATWLTLEGGPGEALAAVTVGWGRHGSLTTGLEHGVPPADRLRPWDALPPAGNTSDPEIPCAGSVADYLPQRLLVDWRR